MEVPMRILAVPILIILVAATTHAIAQEPAADAPDARAKAMEKLFSETPEGAPARPALLLRLGRMYWEHGDECAEEALSASEALAGETPPRDAPPSSTWEARRQELETRREMFATCAATQRARAFEKLEAALADPTWKGADEALFYLGYYSFLQAKTSVGSEWLSRLLKEYPASDFGAEAHLLLGDFYFDQSDLGHAIEMYEKAAEDRKNRIFPYATYKLAWCRLNLGELGKSLELFADAARTTDGSPVWSDLHAQVARDMTAVCAKALEPDSGVQAEVARELCAVVTQTAPTPAMQSDPTPGEQSDPVPTEPVPLTQDPLRSALAEALWVKANQWLGSKHEEAGKLLMEDLSRDFPDTTHGRLAALWLLENRGLNQAGKTELMIGATTNGALLGASASSGLFLDHEDAGKIVPWSSFGAALAGLGISAAVGSHTNVSDSQASLFNFAGLWGWYNGFFVYDLLYPIDSQDVLLAAAAGQTAGMALSVALWDSLDVDEGAAQMAIWSAGYALETAFFLNLAIGGKNVFSRNETVAILGLLIPSNAAALGGYFLGNHLRWTADDVNLIGLGGFLGNLLGGALVATIQDLQGPRSGPTTMVASVVGSLALSTVLLHPWTRAGSTPQPSAPTTALLNFDRDGLTLGLPAPNIFPSSHNGHTALAVELPLLSLDL